MVIIVQSAADDIRTGVKPMCVNEAVDRCFAKETESGELEMKLEAAKEMDKRCVLVWLSDVCRNPAVAFNTYSDDQQIEFAHDAIVLLKEQEAVEPVKWIYPTDVIGFGRCPHCNSLWDYSLISNMFFKHCPRCGREVKWE